MNHFLFLLNFRYNKIKKRYPILGKTKKNNFYYWALFSYKLIRSFKALKSKFFGFKFTQFYFSPSVFNSNKKGSVKYTILLKKKLAFFKKKGDIRRAILFRAGSYAWKRSIFRRKFYKHFYNYKALSSNASKHKHKWDITNNVISKKLNIKLKIMYSKKIKRIKRPLNVKHKFNRLFFSNRKTFELISNFSALRQSKFNNYFSHIFKKNYKSLLNSTNLNITAVLLKAHFVFTRDQANFLVKSNFVFVNGLPITHIHTNITKNSYIQLILHRNYFFFFKRILSNIRFLRKKTGYRVWRLTRFLFNFYKQAATNIPQWVDKLMYYKIDVPKFLEVDYTILTAIVLYTPKNFYESDFYTFKYLNYFLLRLYTWKYIV